MATWYTQHIDEAERATAGLGDTEECVLDLWELLVAPAADAERVATLCGAVARMPWNRHLARVFQDHGLDIRTGAPTRPLDRASLLGALQAAGMGANPMPFPRPTFRPCEVRRQQRVATARGEQNVDHVLVTTDGRAYGLVRNLQTCIYGQVRHGVELEPAEGGGGGLFSVMRRPAWRATDRQVAVKCIERPKYQQHMQRHGGRLNEDPIKEVATMEFIARRGGAPHVLPLLGCYADADTVYVVLPFCPHGDLFGVVEAQGGLAERAAATYMGQIVAGLERLHALGLAHHDMSLENLMVDADRRAVVIDFGMAVKASPTFTRLAAGAPPPPAPGAGPPYFSVPLAPSRGWPCRCGKLLYMAPELFQPSAPFDVFAPDLWALGIILFLLLTGMPPWDAATGPTPTDQRYVYVRDGRLAELLATWHIHLSPHAPDLLQRLLTADPARRMTLPELKAHPWWIANAAFVGV
mmetsp:Transcript_4594/g.13538  ORF Transcript_4594/g.13538 Transcript_4594/m.13538 type:complete len:467 (+) Transcript_4594:231-1631(+)